MWLLYTDRVKIALVWKEPELEAKQLQDFESNIFQYTKVVIPSYCFLGEINRPFSVNRVIKKIT